MASNWHGDVKVLHLSANRGWGLHKFLANKHIVLGVTGSIAAYKSADLVRRLRDAGAIVRVVMSKGAHEFITPLTMQAVSGLPVHSDLFDLQAEAAMGHIALAKWADLVLIAPATADCLARLTQGKADDLLTSICLATTAKVAVAPAMNQAMWLNEATRQNVQYLQKRGTVILGPGKGEQACGDVGPGRMLEVTDILDELRPLVFTGQLAGLNVLLTAGPTREAIDPVRYLTNSSSGKMGYALARAAYEAGAHVTLVSGPVQLAVPEINELISVTSAREMHTEVMKHAGKCDIFFSVAAVADYCMPEVAKEKIKKSDAGLTLSLVRTPDIVSAVAKLDEPPFIVGFAAETHNVVDQAKEKRARKQMDVIIANQVGEGGSMGADDNEVTVLTADSMTSLPRMSKTQLASQLIELVAKQYKQSREYHDREANTEDGH